MKTLYLVRHAKSSWEQDELSDFERPLNDRGLKDAPVMARRLVERGLKPNLIVSSPAVRTLATAREMAKGFGIAENLIISQRQLYLAEDEQLLSVLRECDRYNSPQSVMIVGHNPGLTEFANQLLNSIVDSIPTCGIIGGELELSTWKDASWGKGKMVFYDFPKLG